LGAIVTAVGFGRQLWRHDTPIVVEKNTVNKAIL